MTWWRRGELHPEVVNLRSLLAYSSGQLEHAVEDRRVVRHEELVNAEDCYGVVLRRRR